MLVTCVTYVLQKTSNILTNDVIALQSCRAKVTALTGPHT